MEINLRIRKDKTNEKKCIRAVKECGKGNPQELTC